MGLDLTDYQTKANQAVKDFWKSREAARLKQKKSGKVDQGERAGVTAGKNMNGFLDLVRDLVRGNGLSDADILMQQRLLTLPGYFRPTKQWDMLVINDGRLIAALELKSQVGPSFGNNFNNRSEEVIGSGVDLWTAFREGALGDNPRPFVGWLMLIEDCAASRKPVRTDSPHFPLFTEFETASYADRYNILCRKLMQEQLYSAATLLLASRSAITSGAYTELSEMTGLRNFVTTLAGHVAAAAART